MRYERMDQLRRRLAAAGRHDGHLLARGLGQLEFAKGLAEMQEDRAAEIHAAVARAGTELDRAVEPAGLRDLPAALDAAEEILVSAGLAELAKTYTMHCVGHAHIDMNWQWGWAETVAVTRDTFTTVLALMDEFDDFCLTQSQASVYAIIERYCPELLPAIRRRVAEGRWQVAAAHWVEGDKNLASGESLARHLLYTRDYLADLLGVEPADQPLDWEPDTFGHAVTIPSIVSRGGVRRYYFCRGGRPKKPPVFRWRGPDGSEILAVRESTWYNDRLGHHNIHGMLPFCQATGLRDWMCVYGVGDHGGGPTRRDLLVARDMDSWPVYPNVRFSTTGPFFEILEQAGREDPDRWPVVADELNFEFPGCYTSQSRIKWANRQAECALEMTDTVSALAGALVDHAAPRQTLRRAWTETLLGHFHDILPGSGVRQTREEHMGRFAETMAVTGAARTAALRALVGQLDTRFAQGLAQPISLPPEAAETDHGAGAGRGAAAGPSQAQPTAGARVLAVCNPTAWTRKQVVEVAVWDDGAGLADQRFAAVFSDGSGVDAQELGRGRYWGHDYVDLAVPVEVGPLGAATLAIVAAGRRPQPLGEAYREYPRDQEPADPGVRVESEGRLLENEHCRVEIDSARGGIVSLVDKSSGLDLARSSEPMGLEWVLERPGGMSSWKLHELMQRITDLPVRAFRLAQAGPHRAEVRMEIDTPGESTAELAVRLDAGAPGVAVTVRTRWVEIGSPQRGIPGLRLRLPTRLTDAGGRYEAPFGWIDRPAEADQEVPALRWAQLRGRLDSQDASLLVANDCKYGHRFDGSTLWVNLLRSSYNPDPLPEIGESEMNFVLTPGGPGLPPGRAIQAGTGLNLPLQVVATDIHDGPLPANWSPLGSIEPASALLTGMKPAEHAEGLILRLVWTAEQPGQVQVELAAALADRFGRAEVCDLLERPLAEQTATLAGGRLSVQMGPRAITTVRLLP